MFLSGLEIRILLKFRNNYCIQITLFSQYQVPEGRQYLTNKTVAMFDHAYTEYKDSIDWFLKADDDSYIIMENLRHLLSDLDPIRPHYLGGRIKGLMKFGYNSGGAGYG